MAKAVFDANALDAVLGGDLVALRWPTQPRRAARPPSPDLPETCGGRRLIAARQTRGDHHVKI
jgi:hypothetical protein